MQGSERFPQTTPVSDGFLISRKQQTSSAESLVLMKESVRVTPARSTSTYF